MKKVIRFFKMMWRKLFPPKPQICHDGVFEFNFEKRQDVHEYESKRKPRGGTPPPPPPPPPAGTAVVLVDFDGYTVSGTSWNTSGDIVCAPANMIATDQQAVLAAMKQDYAAFNIIITTDESVYNLADPYRRTRCIVTESYEWFGASGGVAFIGSMFWGDGTPCFVFSSLLHYNPKTIGEAASHEAGHTIGLRHQSVYDSNCVKVAEYNPGNSTCSCAPIMGVSYYQPDGKWWVGPNSVSCTTIQDDSSIIQAKIGLKL